MRLTPHRTSKPPRATSCPAPSRLAASPRASEEEPPRAHPRRRQILGWTLIALRWFIRHERHQRHAGSSPGASPARVTGIPSTRRRHPSSVAVVRAPHASTGHPDRSAPRERTRNQHRVGTPRRPVADPRARPPSAPRGTQDNPQFFVNPLQFEIQYECLQNLANGACPPASRRAAGPTDHRRCRFSRTKSFLKSPVFHRLDGWARSQCHGSRGNTARARECATPSRVSRHDADD